MGDYDYANARLRALKSRLFDARAYAEFLTLTRLDDLVARLAQSAYEDEVKAALARFVGVRIVMEACRMHVAHTFSKLRAFFDDDGARLVGILLARWDLFNLRTILRGQEASARPEEILEALVPAGYLDEAALRLLVRQADPTATIDLLRTWDIGYATALRLSFGEFLTTHDWSLFETSLDTLFYDRLVHSLSRDEENDELVYEFLAQEIDTANVMTALRVRNVARALFQEQDRGQGREDFTHRFVRGGGIAPDWLINLTQLARDDEALTFLRASRFGAALAEVDTLDLAKIQRALDRAFARFGVAFFARDPLTIAPAIGFIAAQGVEAQNLRVIAQGLALNLERAEIERELILV